MSKSTVRIQLATGLPGPMTLISNMSSADTMQRLQRGRYVVGTTDTGNQCIVSLDAVLWVEVEDGAE